MVNQRMVSLAHANNAERIAGAFVTGSFFETLGVKSKIGRTITQKDDEPGHGDVAVIS
jgi:hypothetical protein